MRTLEPRAGTFQHRYAKISDRVKRRPQQRLRLLKPRRSTSPVIGSKPDGGGVPNPGMSPQAVPSLQPKPELYRVTANYEESVGMGEFKISRRGPTMRRPRAWRKHEASRWSRFTTPQDDAKHSPYM